MHRISLDSLTLTDIAPLDQVQCAAAAGFDAVSFWTQVPQVYPKALLTAENVKECRQALEDTGLTVSAVEVFDLHSLAAIEGYRASFELAAIVGARSAVVINLGNDDAGEVADLLARLHELASNYGLAVNLEPIFGGKIATFDQAERLIDASGADVGLVFDPWHFMAAGCAPFDPGRIDWSRVRCVQLCDGLRPLPDDRVQLLSVSERSFPGEGDFPLIEMLANMPDDIPIGVECPGVARTAAGMSPEEQAQRALAAARQTLSRLGRPQSR